MRYSGKRVSIGSVLPKHRDIFRSVVNKYRDRKVLVIGHIDADLDYVSSGSAICGIPETKKWTFTIPEPIHPDITKTLTEMNMFYAPFDKIITNDFEGVIVVDTNTPNLLPEKIFRWKRILVIDHHLESDGVGAENEIIIPKADATARIVAELLHSKEITPKMAIALATGIYTDTFQFSRMQDSETMAIYQELLRIADIKNEYIHQLSYPPATEEEMRLMQHILANNMNVVTYNGTLIAIIKCPYEIARRTILSLEKVFQIIILGTKINGSRLIKLRVRNDFELNGARIMKEIGEQFNGSGGGHEKTAGCMGIGTLDEMIKEALTLVKERITPSQPQ